MSVRTTVWSEIAVLAVAASALFALRFPHNYPQATLEVEAAIVSLVAQVTLPIKLAQLSLREPDAELLMPVYGAKVAQVSDTWQTPRGADRVHEGQDIFAARGTPVFSATAGYIRRIATTTLGGNTVFVTGAGGRRYYYAHLDTIAEGLQVGQSVTTDTVIGFVGTTGNAAGTPPHLHFGVYQSRVAINPLPLLADR